MKTWAHYYCKNNADVVIKIHKNTTIFQNIHGDNLRLLKSNWFYITLYFKQCYGVQFKHFALCVYIYINRILSKLYLDKIGYVLHIIPPIACPAYVLLSVSSDHRRGGKKVGVFFMCFGKTSLHYDVFKSILNAGLLRPFLIPVTSQIEGNIYTQLYCFI